jgi:hypothetical protein
VMCQSVRREAIGEELSGEDCGERRGSECRQCGSARCEMEGGLHG